MPKVYDSYEDSSQCEDLTDITVYDLFTQNKTKKKTRRKKSHFRNYQSKSPLKQKKSIRKYNQKLSNKQMLIKSFDLKVNIR